MTTASETTCTETATATSTGSAEANAVEVLKVFQAMELDYSVTNQTSGQTNIYSVSFAVVRTTPTAYIVNVTSQENHLYNETFGEQFKVEQSGTVDWAYTKISGFTYNATGFQAADTFEGEMVVFELESASNAAYSFSLYTQYFHQVNGTNTDNLYNAGTGQSVRVDYQTYVPNSANENFGFCGSNFQFSQFTAWIGTIQGTSTQVLLRLDVVGTANGTPEDYTLTLGWVWLEPA